MARKEKDTASTTKAGLDASLEKARHSAQKTYEAMTRMGGNQEFLHYNEPDPPPKEFVKTHIPQLNKMLGGGIPLGKFGELFGQEGGGKSTLAYHLSYAFQQAGGQAIYLDSEHSFEMDRFEQIGGDPAAVIYKEVDTLEEIFVILKGILVLPEVSKTPTLIIIDTVAAAPAASEHAAVMAGKEVSRMQGMERGALLSAQLRQFPRLLGSTRCAVVFLNQVRMKPNAPAFVDPWEAPGGKAMKHYPNWRIKVAAVGKLRNGEDVIGQQVKIENIKCKTAPPYQKATLNLIYESGKFDQTAGMLVVMRELNWYRKYKGVIKVLGESLLGLGFAESYESEDGFKAEIEKRIEAVQALIDDSGGVIQEEGGDAGKSAEETEA